jgi:hypothetical protein
MLAVQTSALTELKTGLVPAKNRPRSFNMNPGRYPGQRTSGSPEQASGKVPPAACS